MADTPRADWLERFAAETLKLRPEFNPLDAVRAALRAYPDASELEPENAADAMFAADVL
jgi:hypothetical protein